VDGSLHKSPGTGPNPTDRAKLGWKWSILTDTADTPFGWTSLPTPLAQDPTVGAAMAFVSLHVGLQAHLSPLCPSDRSAGVGALAARLAGHHVAAV